MQNFELPKMNFSRWKTMKACWKKYYEEYLRPDSIAIDVTPSDTTRAFIGSVLQHILESVINKRLYREFTLDQLYEMIDADLKLLKPLIVETKSLEKAIDGQKLFPIEGAKVLEKIQMCATDTSPKYIIYVAQNSLIKKIREMYKAPLKKFIEELDPDKMMSEVPLVVSSPYFKHMGTLDFVIEYPDCIDIIDGKKSYSSYVDDDQLFHYKLMVELKFNKPVRNLYWFIWDENKLYKAKFNGSEDHTGSSEDLLNRMKCRYDYLVSKGWKLPEDYPISPSYGSCMFCLINDNCIGTGTMKEDETFI